MAFCKEDRTFWLYGANRTAGIMWHLEDLCNELSGHGVTPRQVAIISSMNIDEEFVIKIRNRTFWVVCDIDRETVLEDIEGDLRKQSVSD